MAKKKAKYDFIDYEVFRNGKKVASWDEFGELHMEKGCSNYRMVVAGMLKKVLDMPKEDAPDEPIPEPVEEVKEEPKQYKSTLDIKNETRDEEPLPPILQAKLGEHNPWGLTPKEGVPPCPPADTEAGTKSDEHIAWVQKYYPEAETAIYGDFYKKKDYYEQKEALKKKRQKMYQEGS